MNQAKGTGLHFYNIPETDSSTAVIQIKKQISYKKKLSTNVYHSQLAFTCSKLTIETIEQGVKYVQS